MTINANRLSVPATTTVNKDVGGQLFMQGTRQFCLDLGSSKCQVDINTDLTSDVTLSLNQEFLPNIGIQYTYSGSQLLMTAVYGNDPQAWQYDYQKAGS